MQVTCVCPELICIAIRQTVFVLARQNVNKISFFGLNKIIELKPIKLFFILKIKITGVDTLVVCVFAYLFLSAN